MNDNPPVSLAERIARRVGPTTDLGPSAQSPALPVENVAESYEAYKTGGEHRFEAMLTFRLKNGNYDALSYSELKRLPFDPSKQLVLEFIGGPTVTITGRNLTPLFKALAARNVVWIREADPLAEPAEDAATVVNSIEFGEG